MTRLDEVIVSEAQSSEGENPLKVSKSVDDQLRDEDKQLVEEAKRTRLEEIIANRKKRIAEAKRDANRVEEGLPSSNVSVSNNTAAAILKMLIDSGMDADKAGEFLKKLDQESLAKLAILSGGSRGSEFLLPLLMMGKSQGTTASELAEVGRSYIDVANQAMANVGGGPSASELVTMMTTFWKEMRPPDSNPAILAMTAKIDQMQNNYLALLNQMQTERIDHQKEMATVQSNALLAEIRNTQAQVAAFQARDPMAEVQKYKATLETLGFKVGTGGEGGEDKTMKLVETIMKAPAVDKLATAVGDSMKARAGAGRGAAPGSGQNPSSQFLCDTCLKNGVKTTLSPSAAALAGKEPVVCNVCGTSFTRGQ